MKLKPKEVDTLLVLFAIFAIILLAGTLFFLSAEKGGETTTTTITMATTTTTTTTTTSLSTTSTTTTTTTSTTTSTTASAPTTTTTLTRKVKTCDDYCVNKGYKSGICRTAPLECYIRGVNEEYNPMGNRYCPRGEVEDTCCCVTR